MKSVSSHRICRRNLTLLAVVVLLSLGCEESSVSLVDSPAGGTTTNPATSEIAYLTGDEIHEEYDFEGGPLGAPVSFQPAVKFRGVSVRLTTPVPEIYYRTNMDDVWVRLHASETSGDLFHAGYVRLLTATDRIEFWSPHPLSFGRLEFHETPTDEPWLVDDEPGYADETDEVEPGVDEEVDEDSDTLRQSLAKPGRWQLSSSARAAGESTYISYDSPPSYSGGRNCTGGLQRGAQELGEFLVRQFEGARYFDGYACRPVRGGSSMSVHGVGRAVDLFVPLHNGQADNDLGDVIANYLVENARELGVQFIIWDRTKWNASYSGRKDRYYGGQHPHHDHLHIELTKEAARGVSASFPVETAPSAPPPIEFDAPFADDDDNAHLDAIEAIYEAGITGGCADNPLRYCPSREVTRGNAAVMLQRALGLSSVQGDFFGDDDGLAAESAINALAARDIVTGCDAAAGRYCPSDPLTRRQLAVILDRALQLGSTSEDYFTDDDGKSYEASANRLAAAGITNGCGDQRYCGTAAVHRDEFASFLARAVGLLPGFNAQPLAYRGHFADDDGHLFESDIDAVAAAGIVKGCVQGDTPRYCPDDAATRAQMATMLVRAFNLPASNVDAFDDDDGNPHESAINALAASGITAGCDDGKFCPQQDVTRGQLAVFLQRAAGFPATSTDYFDDDAGTFYEDSANRLAAADITSGCGGTRRFCGGRAATRGELAAFLRRTLGL